MWDIAIQISKNLLIPQPQHIRIGKKVDLGRHLTLSPTLNQSGWTVNTSA